MLCKDRHFVWCLGGEFRPYDIETFEVCDDGFNKNLMHQTFYFSDGSSADGTTQISSGYAKDKYQVYCYDHTGKVKILKGADPKTFVSCNNGKFAKDSRYIYYYFHQIKKQIPKHGNYWIWKKVILVMQSMRSDLKLVWKILI